MTFQEYIKVFGAEHGIVADSGRTVKLHLDNDSAAIHNRSILYNLDDMDVVERYTFENDVFLIKKAQS